MHLKHLQKRQKERACATLPAAYAPTSLFQQVPTHRLKRTHLASFSRATKTGGAPLAQAHHDRRGHPD